LIANPLHAVKLYQDYMLKAKELAIRKAELDKKQKGATGGIRIVLPSHVADPLLRPGQPPRPLRLLGQDPSKPLPGAGTPDDNQPLARHQLGACRFPQRRRRPRPSAAVNPKVGTINPRKGSMLPN
jgi:hypothetical protein